MNTRQALPRQSADSFSRRGVRMLGPRVLRRGGTGAGGSTGPPHRWSRPLEVTREQGQPACGFLPSRVVLMGSRCGLGGGRASPVLWLRWCGLGATSAEWGQVPACEPRCASAQSQASVRVARLTLCPVLGTVLVPVTVIVQCRSLCPVKPQALLHGPWAWEGGLAGYLLVRVLWGSGRVPGPLAWIPATCSPFERCLVPLWPQ